MRRELITEPTNLWVLLCRLYEHERILVKVFGKRLKSHTEHLADYFLASMHLKVSLDW